MRVMILSQFISPIVGGEEQHVEHLSQELVKKGHTVSIVSLWIPGQSDFEEKNGLRIYRIKGLFQRAEWLFKESARRHSPPMPDPLVVNSLRKIINREKPEIVHAHNWILYSFLPLKNFSKAKLVVTLHDYSLRCATKRLMYQHQTCLGPGYIKCIRCASEHYGPLKGIGTAIANWVSHPAARRAIDLFITVSHAVAEGNAVSDFGVPHHVVPNFISANHQASPAIDISACLSRLPKSEFILYVGDISTEKGVNILLKAYNQIEPQLPLVLIGRDFLNVEEKLPDQAYYLGSWPHAAVMEAYRRCKFTVIPSSWSEPFGIVAMEAMSAGRPIIATKVGGLQDLITDGENGLLVQPGDIHDLGRAIKILMTDDIMCLRMGSNNLKRLTKYSAAEVIPQIEKLYSTLLHDNL